MADCFGAIQQRDYFGAHTFRVLPGKENSKLKASENIRP
jgi:6-phosphogluconate dehydrogenase